MRTEDAGSEGGRAPRPGPDVPALAAALAAEEEALLACVHCGFCLPACPTYVRLGDENDSPRGRLYLMRAVVEGRLDAGSDAFQLHIDRCLGCRACEPVCPSGVPYGNLLEVARVEAVRARLPDWVTRSALRVFASPAETRAFGLAARAFRATRLPALAARVLPAIGGLSRLRLALGMLAASRGWAELARAGAGRAPAGDGEPGGTGKEPLPRTGDGARQDPPFRTSDRAGSSPSTAGGAGGGEGLEGPPPFPAVRQGRVAHAEREPEEHSRGVSAVAARVREVALLEGCVQAVLFRRVNQATRRVLRVNGFAAREVDDQVCCGALHAHAGDLEGARQLARRNVEAFERSGVDRVVVNAAGCGAAMKEYGHLLRDDPDWADRAARLAARVRDVSEVLAGEGPVRGGTMGIRVAYDAPCHLLHAQGVADAPLRLLEAVPGLDVVTSERYGDCCGGAGIYGLKHPELGRDLGRDRAEAARRTGATVVATGNPGCVMQIGAALRMTPGPTLPVVHPVELLDESYRRRGLYRV